MSDRTLTPLLGRTRLERRCRLVAGGLILGLVTFTTYWLGKRAERLLLEQKAEAARMLADAVLLREHTRSFLTTLPADMAETGAGAPAYDPGYASHIVETRQPGHPDAQPRDEFERETLAGFRQAAQDSATIPSWPHREPFTFPNNAPTERTRVVEVAGGRKEYQYMRGMLFETRCLLCHAGRAREVSPGRFAPPRQDELAAVVVVTLPMDRTTAEIHRHRARLLRTALVTAALAMVGSFMVIRYGIARPE